LLILVEQVRLFRGLAMTCREDAMSGSASIPLVLVLLVLGAGVSRSQGEPLYSTSFDDFELLRETPKDLTEAPKVATEPIAELLESRALFVSGTADTHTFRIPAIITALNGDLIAACDARRQSGADLIHVRDIDIVVKRSADNGRTWSDMELVCDFGDGRPASDPSMILDRTTGEIFCFYNTMDQDTAPKEFRLYVQRSKDNGKTWGPARGITDQIAKPAWKMDFKFITSGRGIQTRGGDLLHTLVNLKNGLHLFRSRDHGDTWHLIDVPVRPADESKVIELADGRWMINSRVNGEGCRWVHVSGDDGQTWTSRPDRSLVDPGCNGSILRYTSVKDGYNKNRLLFCNANAFQERRNLSVRISYDEGETWSDGKVIDPGPSAYSSLTICQDGSIAVLYEPGYDEVRFVRFTLEALTDGNDKLSKPYRVSAHPAPALQGEPPRP
jgi:sialidase-1